MFKSKSFQLVSEEESRKREHLNDPKRIRLIEYILGPALMVFALLLILCNVDFAGGAYVTPTLSTGTIDTTPALEPTTTQEFETILTSANPNEWKNALTRRTSYKLLGQMARTTYADCVEKVYCTQVVCSGGEITSIVYQLEEMNIRCGQNLIDLLLEKCTLPNGTLNKKLLNGSFTLNNFTIDDCGLEHIEKNAFNRGSLWKLKTLIFKKSSLTELDESVFKKLTRLVHFEMRNEQQSSALSAQDFLSPVVSSLKSFILQQQQSTTTTIYDPADWLGGLKLVKLTHVDMSENNFGDTLTSATFVSLVAVKQLYLASSGITSIAEGTFDVMLGTLTFLDLSKNALKILDANFLEKAALKGLRLELYGNAWNCDCESESFVEAITSAEFQFSEEPKCETPEEWRGMDIREIKLECGIQIITTPSTTTTNDTGTETPTTEDPSTETALSTNLTTLNTTTNGITSSSNSESTETDETNETSSADNSDTLECSDSTDDGTSLVSTTSTPSPSTPATHICSTGTEPGYVWCLCGEKVRWTICDSDANFSVEPTSTTSVRLIIQNDMDDLNVIHFTSRNLTDSVASIRTGGSTRNVETATVVDITGLATNESHVFCLVPDNWRTISPFNCRSQFLDVERVWSQAWLHKSDMALYVPLATAGVLVCVVLGLAAIYWLLRWRPNWLRGNKRVRRLDSTSHQVLLFSRQDRASVDQKQYALSELANMRASVTDDLTPENCFNIRSYDYMQYYKNSELFRHRKLPQTPWGPAERAPAPPHERSSDSGSRHTSFQSTVRAEDTTPSGYSNNEYESLDDYVKIYG